MVQTDSGTEFTSALLVIKIKHKTCFGQILEDMAILYHRIRIATPRHNGKVERLSRTDQERFFIGISNIKDSEGQDEEGLARNRKDIKGRKPVERPHRPVVCAILVES